LAYSDIAKQLGKGKGEYRNISKAIEAFTHTTWSWNKLPDFKHSAATSSIKFGEGRFRFFGSSQRMDLDNNSLAIVNVQMPSELIAQIKDNSLDCFIPNTFLTNKFKALANKFYLWAKEYFYCDYPGQTECTQEMKTLWIKVDPTISFKQFVEQFKNVCSTYTTEDKTKGKILEFNFSPLKSWKYIKVEKNTELYSLEE
jgi:hypothetical protein